MIYISKIQEALEFAIKVHQNQTRKVQGEPFIVHPLMVALILARAGASEDVIVAGLLHDTIEDSKPPNKITKEDLTAKFGAQVADVVDNLTEQNKNLPWHERKAAALKHIPQMDRDSLLVKSADVLHNMTDMIEEYGSKGEAVFNHFNAPKNQQFERYKKLVRTLENVWPENPLSPALQVAFTNFQKKLSIK